MRKNNLWILLLVVGVAVCVGWTAVEKSKRPQPTPKQEPAVQTVAQPQDASVVEGVSEQVLTSMRGFVVPGLTPALAQVVKAGDNVDVLVTIKASMKDGGTQRVTYTLLQNVKVLKVGLAPYGPLDKDGKSYEEAYVVLLLTPRDAQYLALSSMEGVLDVVVRGPGDADNYLMEIATLGKLFS